MSAKPDNFNWVQAHLDCSLEREFQELAVQAKIEMACRSDSLKPDDGFSFEYVEKGTDKKNFVISREPLKDTLGVTLNVDFYLRNDHICVVPIDKDPFSLTLDLNENGDCRYRIDKKGEYQRWQVLRLALEHILFEGAG